MIYDGHPILVGVDDSPEGWAAVPAAATLARHAGSSLHVIHATRDVLSAVRHITMAAAATASSSPLGDVSVLDERMVTLARERIRTRLLAMHGLTPVPELNVEVGRAAEVLSRTAASLDAAMIVVGAKRHGVVGRWLGGSTAHALVRSGPIPVVVTVAPPDTFRRILVAIDLSDCAPTIVDSAHYLGQRLGAEVRIVHVVETIPDDAKQHVGITQRDFHRLSCEVCEDIVPLAAREGQSELAMRQGDVITVLGSEVTEWDANLLVVGSHSASRMNRLVLGSTTERLLRDLPVSTLFVPPPEDWRTT